jgi:hypothetical protein
MNGWRGCVGTVRRLVWPGRNHLVRGSDRLEAWLLVTLLCGIAAVFPLAAIAGRAACAQQLAESARQVRSAHPTSATLLADAPPPVALGEGIGTMPSVVAVSARWPAPDGATRTGIVDAGPGSRAGTTVTVWTSATGDPVAAPASSTTALTKGIMTGILVWFAVAAWLAVCYASTRRLIEQHRLAAWERAWSTFDEKRC